MSASQIGLNQSTTKLNGVSNLIHSFTKSINLNFLENLVLNHLTTKKMKIGSWLGLQLVLIDESIINIT